MKTIEKQYRIKYEIEGYYITSCNKIFNPKTNRELKQSMVNYTIGYYLNSKFRSIGYIRNNCKKYKIEKLIF